MNFKKQLTIQLPGLNNLVMGNRLVYFFFQNTTYIQVLFYLQTVMNILKAVPCSKLIGLFSSEQ